MIQIANNKTLLIGNSDGIGLGTTQALLDLGWQVIGISRSKSSLVHAKYSHKVMDVQDSIYPKTLRSVLEKLGSIDLCIYCAGIGELLNLDKMEEDVRIFEVNLMGLVKTVSVVISRWSNRAGGISWDSPAWPMCFGPKKRRVITHPRPDFPIISRACPSH